ncbi:hypothetical protein [Fusobacterium sp. PH5-44]|uniref:hypothetical protein n=1 Tax=unclassified Fusobacterium TaxID=2648384 RepID=UPI003D21D889
MKKSLCIILFMMIVVVFYRISYRSIPVEGTNIIFSVKKIPCNNGFKSFSYRFPFDEYFISLEEIYAIDYEPNKTWKNTFAYHNDGIYSKKYSVIEMNKHLRKKVLNIMNEKKIWEIIKNYQGIECTNLGLLVSVGEMTAKDYMRTTNKKISGFSKSEIFFILKNHDSKKQQKIFFDILYEITVNINEKQYVFYLGSNSEKYENHLVRELIDLLNELNNFLEEKKFLS